MVNVQYQINRALDAQMAMEFLGTNFGGVDFGRNVWEHHPELKGKAANDAHFIYQYFEQYYQAHLAELESIAADFQRSWEMVQSDFLAETTTLFRRYPFPKGDYIGYLSTYSCNPRFLESKTFQIFSGSPTPNQTTAHELMHFIFYDYTQNNLPELTEGLSPNEGLWWDVAEIFNSVVLSSERYRSILHTDGDIGYPVHQDAIIKATKLYLTSIDINHFVKALFTVADNKSAV